MPYKRSKNTTKPKAKHLGQNTKETQTREEDHQNDGLIKLERS